MTKEEFITQCVLNRALTVGQNGRDFNAVGAVEVAVKVWNKIKEVTKYSRDQ